MGPASPSLAAALAPVPVVVRPFGLRSIPRRYLGRRWVNSEHYGRSTTLVYRGGVMVSPESLVWHVGQPWRFTGLNLYVDDELRSTLTFPARRDIGPSGGEPGYFVVEQVRVVL